MSGYNKCQNYLFFMMIWSLFYMGGKLYTADLIGGFIDGKKEITLNFNQALEESCPWKRW